MGGLIKWMYDLIKWMRVLEAGNANGHDGASTGEAGRVAGRIARSDIWPGTRQSLNRRGPSRLDCRRHRGMILAAIQKVLLLVLFVVFDCAVIAACCKPRSRRFCLCFCLLSASSDSSAIQRFLPSCAAQQSHPVFVNCGKGRSLK